jgi:hypothetical protein
MRGSIPPLPSHASGRGTQLKTHRYIYLYILLLLLLLYESPKATPEFTYTFRTTVPAWLLCNRLP